MTSPQPVDRAAHEHRDIVARVLLSIIMLVMGCFLVLPLVLLMSVRF